MFCGLVVSVVSHTRYKVKALLINIPSKVMNIVKQSCCLKYWEQCKRYFSWNLEIQDPALMIGCLFCSLVEQIS